MTARNVQADMEPLRWGTADAEITAPPPSPPAPPPSPPAPTPLLVGGKGYQKFPLSEPVVGQNIALVAAVPAYRAAIST